MITCPQCNQAQRTIDLFAMLTLWFDLRPRVWLCPNCSSSLSFTTKGILLFWGLCFPVALGMTYFLFYAAIKKFSPLVAVAVVVAMIITLFVSTLLKKAIYKITLVAGKQV